MKIEVSDSIVLREIELEDANSIFKTIDSQREYLGRWLPFVVFTQSVDFSRAFVQSILDTPFEVREHTFTILYDGEFPFDWDSRSKALNAPESCIPMANSWTWRFTAD